jgi:hypothetical protein
LIAVGRALLLPSVPAIRALAERELLDLVEASLPWAHAVGRVAVATIGLSWFTAAFFVLLTLFFRVLPSWLDRASRGLSTRVAWLRWQAALVAVVAKRPRIIGSLLNLLAGTLALWTFSWLTGFPLDARALGIEAAIVLVVEAAILFWAARAGSGARWRA